MELVRSAMEHSHEMREQWSFILFILFAQTAPVPKIEPHFKRNIGNFSMFNVRFLFLSSWHIINHKSKNYLHNVALTWHDRQTAEDEPLPVAAIVATSASVSCSQVLVLPPEKRMGKAPPDDVDSYWFDVVIAKETHEYQARTLPP